MGGLTKMFSYGILLNKNCFLETNYFNDKGKLLERVGRKAAGLKVGGTRKMAAGLPKRL